jgi:CheY-like chemotaxis protein
MHQLVHAVVGMVAETLEEKAIRLELQLDAAFPEVDADQARMQQVLWNILRNAAKFTPRGGRLRLRTENVEGGFRLACTDSGIGIAADALLRIFSPFEQADAEVSKSFGGLGLGLAIAQGLMAQHGGRIEVRSDGRDTGATFTVVLPVAAPARAEAPAIVAAAQPDAGARRRVLLVEDNEDAALALSMCLEYYGYAVHHVATCAEALRTVRQDRFDAVLTDLGLPDGSGIEIGRALAGELPVLALSGYGREQDRQRSAEAGFAAHLIKPADPAEVHAALLQVLSGAVPVASPLA